MATKLCEKRFTLEKKLADTFDKDTEGDLHMLKESMKGFGISEIDYQATLVKLNLN